MKIEITEDLINEGTQSFYKGDVTSALPEKTAKNWVAWGWAKDATTGEQGERKPGPTKLNVDNVTQSSAKK